MKELTKWVSANNVPNVDVIKAFDQDRDCLLSWVHLNAKGNKIIASEFAREILRHVCSNQYGN